MASPGNSYLALDDPRAAERAYRGGIDAGDIRSHLNLGRLLDSLGRAEEAEAQYELGAAAGDEVARQALLNRGSD